MQFVTCLPNRVHLSHAALVIILRYGTQLLMVETFKISGDQCILYKNLANTIY